MTRATSLVYYAAMQNVNTHNAVTHKMLSMSHLIASKFDKLGDFLREWREGYKGTIRYKSLKEIAATAGVDPSQLSKLEGNYLNSFWKWNPKEQYKVLHSYDLPKEVIIEVSEHFKLEASIYVAKPAPIPQTITKGELVSIRDLGAIQAGLKGLSFPNDDYEYANVHKDDLNGYNPENCFRVTVTGDSMVCDDVSQRIIPGSKAIFHTITPRMQPKDGSIVAVWLSKEDLGVIKVFRKASKYATLNSLNKRHRPIVMDENNQGVIQGVLISVTQMYS
jgi:hypothetical protein